MGTNYYHETDICECCNRPNERTHIGKSSGGWTFTFHGPPGIRSYTEWLDRLEAGGRIVDEYGEVVSVQEFRALVRSKADAPNNHTTYCLTSPYPGDREHGIRDCWLDEAGHSFSAGEFS